ncbi:hypothetical protein Tco_0446745 [Tanacetum coccineum]
MENSKSSFVSVLKHGNQSPVTPENSKPALVLDESCIKEYDFGMSLIGKAKDVYAIPNLPYFLASKEKFLSHTGIGSWFSDIIQATSSFVNNERMFRFRLRVFLSKHGLLTLFVRLHHYGMTKIFSFCMRKSQEDDVSNKDDKTESDVDRVSESSFMHENDFVHKDVTCSKTREVGTHSEDPFNIYGLLDGQKNKACNSGSEDPKFPPLAKSWVTIWNVLGNKVKRSWIKELCQKHRINFVSIQVTKAENIDLRTIRIIVGNQMFDHVVRPVGCFKRSQLAIRGTLVNGEWISEPHRLKILERIVTYDEVKRAVWDCSTNKSPGPDGFSFEFYHKYWTTIDEDVFQAVRDFFVNGHFRRGCNSSFIALIPKIQDA